ncbi:MAG: putative metal-dependent hydrolase [Cytophagales bacterium]
MNNDIENQKYPIGKFKKPVKINDQQIQIWIGIIEIFPEKIKTELETLNDQDFEKKYRNNGWTIRQIVNHCADSHMNSFIRFKLALTEDKPIIKPYFENLWAELSDSKDYPVDSSIKILEGLHERWVHLLKNLSDNDLQRQFIHPESNESVDLKTNIGIYAWHCEHHLAHIKNAKISGI